MYNYIRQGALLVAIDSQGYLLLWAEKLINNLYSGNPNMISQNLWGEIENSSEFPHTGMY